MRLMIRILQKIAVMIIVCMALLAASAVVPRLFGYVPYAVMSGSMKPKIPVGALVYIDTNNKTVQVDDVIAYSLSNGTTVTHRVAAVQDGGYITKGDANDDEDLAPVNANQVIGKYVFHIPLIGYIFSVPAAKLLWLLITLISAVFILTSKKEGKLNDSKE